MGVPPRGRSRPAAEIITIWNFVQGLELLPEEGLDSAMAEKNTFERDSINITDIPEFGIVVFSFLLHFVWEFIQAPAYAGMIELNHWEGIKLCTSATFGDVGFASTAYWLTSLASKNRHWIFDVSASHWQLLLFLAVGLGLTMGFEYNYTNISLR
jgi:hypothetical protein